jgi:hypothetical protein
MWNVPVEAKSLLLSRFDRYIFSSSFFEEYDTICPYNQATSETRLAILDYDYESRQTARQDLQLVLDYDYEGRFLS